jgi:PhzF family phenazine biosynthesis protein
MELPLYQIDAFTSRLFGGNPAAVCPLDTWLEDATLQAIASENNLSETAFFLRGAPDRPLRWFTPSVEVPLCGHATLASAHVLMNELKEETDEVTFRSRERGELMVRRVEDDRLELDFPASRVDARPEQQRVALAEALGCDVSEAWSSDLYDMVVLEGESAVRDVSPDVTQLEKITGFCIVTAAGDEVDFVSRFFAPGAGIAEDPVTGSAHCVLTPFWAERLGRKELHARQLSARGGELWCASQAERVRIAGHAVTYLRGSIVV